MFGYTNDPALTQRYRVRELLHLNGTVHWIYRKASVRSDLRNHKGGIANLPRRINCVDRVTAQSRAPVVGVARH